MNILAAHYEVLLLFRTIFVFWLAMAMGGLSSVRRGFSGIFGSVTRSFGGNTLDESGKAHPGPRTRSSREPMPGSIVQESETRDIHHRLPAKDDTETKLESQTPPSTNTYQNVQSRLQPLKIPVKESEPKAAEVGHKLDLKRGSH